MLEITVKVGSGMLNYTFRVGILDAEVPPQHSLVLYDYSFAIVTSLLTPKVQVRLSFPHFLTHSDVTDTFTVNLTLQAHNHSLKPTLLSLRYPHPTFSPLR